MLSSLVASPFPMDTPDRISSSEEIEEFFGGILDYSRLGQDALLVQAKQRLLRNKAFSVVNFPAQKSDYANFCPENLGLSAEAFQENAKRLLGELRTRYNGLSFNVQKFIILMLGL